MEPFGFLSAFVGGGEEIARYAQGARLQTDNRMALEFSGPRAVNLESPDDNAAALIALREHGRRRPAVAGALAAAGAAEWRNRAAMMWQANAYRPAYDDYARALALDPSDSAAAMGLVRAAAASARDEAAATLLTRLAEEDSARAAPRIALSRLRASHGQIQDAIDVAVDACRAKPPQAAAFEQLASIYADVGDADALSPVVDTMTGVFPEHPATRYYAAALRFLRGQLPEALALTEHAMAADASRAATRNLLGVIHASQGNVGAARDAFRAALAIDPRDTATYTNLARLELTASNPAVAQRLFTEALTLDPKSEVARQGLAEARTQRFQ
jgi:Flp pilus assembly protein TadD